MLSCSSFDRDIRNRHPNGDPAALPCVYATTAYRVIQVTLSVPTGNTTIILPSLAGTLSFLYTSLWLSLFSHYCFQKVAKIGYIGK
ncbi:hypothetical protein EXU85_24455 [Spirosoma sp. KCTC 42546]|nr:hypothetical protein EXU85_24455 [Spirosoma sp. KCTC 42546]